MTSRRAQTKAARLIALGYAIQEQFFDPATVNMSDLAEVFDVHRGTIMRDLEDVTGVLSLSKEYQAQMRAIQPGTTPRHKGSST